MQTYGIPPIVSARDIQRGYRKVFDSVKKTQKPVVVMANNTPQAVIISVEMLEEFNRLRTERGLWEAIEEIRARNADKNPDEVMRDITADVEEVRKKVYENAFGGR